MSVSGRKSEEEKEDKEDKVLKQNEVAGRWKKKIKKMKG